MGASEISAGKAFLQLLVDDKEFAKGLDEGLKKLDGFGKSALKIGAAMGAAGAAITAPFVASLKVFADVGSALNDMSARTGVSVEALSELKFAAKQSGTDMETLEGSLRKMQKAIGEAASGGGAAVEKFSALGLSVAELSKMSPDQQFTKIAMAINGIKDPTQRAAAAMAIFGKSGTMLLPLIADMESLRAQAKKLGVTMSTEAAHNADALGDAWDALKAQSIAVSVALGSAVAPAVTKFLTAVQAALPIVIEFIKTHGTLITLVGILGSVLLGLSTIFLTLKFAIHGATEAVHGLEIAMKLMARNPWGALATVAIIVILTALGPLIEKLTEKLLGNSEASEGAANATAAMNEQSKKAARAQAELSAAMAAGTKVIDARAEAIDNLNKTEQFWLRQSDAHKKDEAKGKTTNDLRVSALNEQIRSSDAGIAQHQAALNEEFAGRNRLLADQAAGGSSEHQAFIAQQLAANDERRRAIAAEIVRMEEERNHLIEQRDELNGDAAKRREDEAKQLAEAQAKAAEEQQRLQEEAIRAASQAREKHQSLVQSAAGDIVSQFDSFGRAIRGGTGGKFAEQIAGSSASESREARMLRISDEARGYLKEINDILKQSGALVIGTT